MEDDVYAPPESALITGGDSEGFSLARCFEEGGSAFRRHSTSGMLATVLFALLLALAGFGFSLTFGVLANAGDTASVVVGFLVFFVVGITVFYVFYRTLQAGMVELGIGMVRDSARLEDCLQGFTRFPRVAASALLMYLVQVITPLLVLGPLSVLLVYLAGSEILNDDWNSLDAAPNMVLPGIILPGYLMLLALKFYLDGRLFLAFPLILERDAHVIEAIAGSWRLTAPLHLWLGLLAFLNEILFLIGLLCCGLGALVTFPLHYAIWGAAAVQVLGETGAASAQPPSTESGQALSGPPATPYE